MIYQISEDLIIDMDAVRGIRWVDEMLAGVIFLNGDKIVTTFRLEYDLIKKLYMADKTVNSQYMITNEELGRELIHYIVNPANCPEKEEGEKKE